jgi:hypothetical protein
MSLSKLLPERKTTISAKRGGGDKCYLSEKERLIPLVLVDILFGSGTGLIKISS